MIVRLADVDRPGALERLAMVSGSRADR
jgi:hypothetical protein